MFIWVGRGGLIRLLRGIKYFKFLTGNLTMPPGTNGFFLLDALRNEDGDFEFKDGTQAMANYFTVLKLQPDDDSEYCAAARFVSGSNSMGIYEANCNTVNTTVCRTWINEPQDCSKPFVKRVTI